MTTRTLERSALIDSAETLEPSYKIRNLAVYPIKGMGGIELESGDMQEIGLFPDRRIMLVDEDNTFITQREAPLLATIQTSLQDNKVVLSHQTSGEINLSLHPSLESQQSEMFREEKINVLGNIERTNADNWVSEILNRRVRFVRQNPEMKRLRKNRVVVSLADGYPLLVTTRVSLHEINQRIAEHHSPLPMIRFRPNIVIEGEEAFEEFGWKTIKIGGQEIIIAGPCTRCVVTTTDQLNGSRPSHEPLTTLSSMKKEAILNGIHFGVYAYPVGEMHEIRINDEAQVFK